MNDLFDSAIFALLLTLSVAVLAWLVVMLYELVGWIVFPFLFIWFILTIIVYKANVK